MSQEFGGRMSDIVIQMEVEFLETYSGQPLFEEIISYMNQNDFVLVGFTHVYGYFADAVFVRRDLVENRLDLRVRFRNRFLCSSGNFRRSLYLISRRIHRKALVKLEA